MDRPRQFVLEDFVDHALALEPALAGETRCDNSQPEMALAAGPGAGMAGMLGGFVDDIESRRRQGGLELDAHVVGDGHGVPFPCNRLPEPSHKSILMAMTRRVRMSRQKIAEEEIGASAAKRGCEWPECDLMAVYPAPSSPRNLNQKLWFCLHHVRDYNVAWDYFDGMSGEEIAAYRRDSITGHRPTWPFDAPARGYGDGVEDRFDILAARFGTAGFVNGRGSPGKEMAWQPGEWRALQTLGLDGSATLNHIRERYKELVKRYHPDAGGAKSSEDRLKRVIDAYHRLTDGRSR